MSTTKSEAKRRHKGAETSEVILTPLDTRTTASRIAAMSDIWERSSRVAAKRKVAKAPSRGYMPPAWGSLEQGSARECVIESPRDSALHATPYEPLALGLLQMRHTSLAVTSS